MEILLLGLIILSTLIYLYRKFLIKRHDHILAKKVIIGVVIASLLSSLVTFLLELNEIRNENTSAAWQRVSVSNLAVSELLFRPEIGLFAISGDNEIMITNEVPFCFPDGQIALSPPAEVETTVAPRVILPPHPKQIKQQISFDFIYPFGADMFAASSFVITENDEVWCTERYEAGGLSGGAVVGFAAFIFLYWSVTIFLGSFFVLAILSIFALEIYRWRKANNVNKIDE